MEDLQVQSLAVSHREFDPVCQYEGVSSIHKIRSSNESYYEGVSSIIVTSYHRESYYERSVPIIQIKCS